MDTVLTPQQHYEKALLYFPGSIDYYIHMITAANQGHIEAQKRFLFGFTMTNIDLLIEAGGNPSLIREKIICSDEYFGDEPETEFTTFLQNNDGPYSRSCLAQVYERDNFDKMEQLFEESSELPFSTYFIGMKYHHKLNDPEKAMQYFEKSANEGCPLAMTKIGQIYESEKKDEDKALQFYNQAADLGYGYAYMCKAELYFEKKEYDRVLECCDKLIKVFSRDAVMMAAQIYTYRENYQTVVDILTPFAHPNHPKFYTALGFAYEKLRNYTEAIKCYEAGKYFPFTLNNLARLYIDGIGVDVDLEKAWELFKLIFTENKTLNFSENFLSVFRSNLVFMIDESKGGILIRIIDFFISINRVDVIETIINPDLLQTVIEKHKFKIKCEELERLNMQQQQKINELMEHINLTPGGKEYLELLDEWNKKNKN